MKYLKNNWYQNLTLFFVLDFVAFKRSRPQVFHEKAEKFCKTGKHL